MSSHTPPRPAGGAGAAVTTLSVRNAKGKRKLSMVTAYDFPFALLADEAGIEMVLVGDSLGMVVLGRKDTLSVTLDEMIHHTRTVVSAVSRALVIADMPFMSYEPGVDTALASATRLVREAGVRAVKLEGGREVAPQVKALVGAGIPVVGHIGLTPQRAAVLGGFRVQGKTAASAQALLADAEALEAAGSFALVLEAVPAQVGALITESIAIPTIGIGAGPECDGQVLVMHDMLGLNTGHVPKFVKKYASLADTVRDAFRAYAAEVEAGTFPGLEHGFTMDEAEAADLRKSD